ncbi:MAG: helix-turn-helix domain-containing protein [Bacteroidetes bacterium]|nr:helix-turn-helix domain-containing protein [Bacteroidota bacterium]
MIPVFIQLRQARKEKKLTLQAVADRLEIDIALISKMERGQRPISEKQLNAFCKLYELDLTTLKKTVKAEEIISLLQGYDHPEEILKLAEMQLLYRTKENLSIAKIQSTLKSIFNKFQAIQSAWIFGSFARGENNEQSDIDIVITADRGFSYFQLADVQHQAEEKLKTKVDIGFKDSMKPEIMRQIEVDLQLIYERI